MTCRCGLPACSSGWRWNSGPTKGQTVCGNLLRTTKGQTICGNTFGTATISDFNYDNDAVGRQISRTDTTQSLIETNAFGYNLRSEVTNTTMVENTYSDNYDPIGNRLQSTVDSGQSAVTNSYTANGLNQYTNITGGVVSAPTYDLDGNMTFLPSTSGGGAGGEGWHCQWDAENRLVSASNLTTAVVCNFIYDHQSRRISKTTLTPNPSSSLTSKFTYDGWNLISEVADDQTAVTTNIYAWGLDLSGSLQGAGGVGGLLSQTIITPTTVKSYFPLADANGNCVSFIDDAGNVQAHYTYDAFGNTVSQSGTMAADFRFRFSSKYLDDETGLYYYGYRYDSPSLGRWLSRDPITELGFMTSSTSVRNAGSVFLILMSLNPELQSKPLYLFVDNDPVGRFDYLGLDDCVCPSGSSTGKKQKDGYEKVTDGCTSSPDSYMGCSFFPACKNHDFCYQTCNASRLSCDNKLFTDMMFACVSCSVTRGPMFLMMCYNHATAYWAAVRVAGNMDTSWGFDNFQEAACEDCCCD